MSRLVCEGAWSEQEYVEDSDNVQKTRGVTNASPEIEIRYYILSVCTSYMYQDTNPLSVFCLANFDCAA